jgi:hypothetical protein
MREFLIQLLRATSMGRMMWRRCAATGAWILEMVAGVGSTTVAVQEPLAAAAPVLPDLPEGYSDPELSAVRMLAGAIAADCDRDHHYKPLGDHTIRWLSQLDRPALIRIAGTLDKSLRDHIRGKCTITGILAADPDSVQAWIDAKKRAQFDVIERGGRSGKGGPARSSEVLVEVAEAFDHYLT